MLQASKKKKKTNPKRKPCKTIKIVGYDFQFNSKDEEHPTKKNGGGLGCSYENENL
jgi:hypothetical protein